jgi:hypothetical protein
MWWRYGGGSVRVRLGYDAMKKRTDMWPPPVSERKEKALLGGSAAGLGCWAAAALGGPRGQARKSSRPTAFGPRR